jgi:hypothetical protein
VIREFSRHFEVIPSRRFEETVEAVRRDGFLMLYPGGVRDVGDAQLSRRALRP